MAHPGVEVVLTIADWLRAMRAALERVYRSTVQGLNHATVSQRTHERRAEHDFIGAVGEIAVAKWLGLDAWRPLVDVFHDRADCGLDVEVRATTFEDGCLILRDNDPPERSYVLATVRLEHPARVVLRGWALGRDVQVDAYKRNPHEFRPAWFMPQSALRPMATLAVEETATVAMQPTLCADDIQW